MATYVEVVCPNGRWQRVKVTAMSSMLQVLEEVCTKQKFVPPSQYMLKHGKKKVDLTLSFRYSGLPNHSKLELVETDEERKEQPVKVALQFPDGSRIIEEFEPKKYLWEILQESISKASENVRQMNSQAKGSDHVFLYVTERIVGEDALKRTQLRNLGLFGGRAIIRYLIEDNSQVNVESSKIPEKEVISDPVIKKPKIEEKEIENPLRECPNSSGQISSIDSTENITSTQSETFSDQEPTQLAEVSSEVPMDQSEAKVDNRAVSSSTCSSTTLSDSFIKPRPVKNNPLTISSADSSTKRNLVCIPSNIEDREVRIYNSADTPEFKPKEESDDFFEVTVNDVRKMMEDLRASVKSAFNQPLMTQKLRKEALNSRFSNYKRAIIRFTFSNRLVIQACFGPGEKLRSLYKFIRECLDGNPKIQLYTTPPKKILKESNDNLIESYLVPLSKVYVKLLDQEDINLKSDIMQNITQEEDAVSVIKKWTQKN